MRPWLTRPIKLVLFAAMAALLPITMAGEAVALAYNGEPIGNQVGTVTDVLGWLFAAAFLTVFILMIADQNRRMRAADRQRAAAP